MNHRERIGLQLADFRKAKGYTLRQLEGISGITNQNISKIERGRYNVSIDILSRICDSLDIEIQLGRKTERKP